MKPQTKQWLEATAITVTIAAMLSFYLFARRGYYNLYIINKVAGSTAAILAALILILGPLARNFDAFDRFASLRKHFGFIALGLGGAHALVSLFFMPQKFPLPWFLTEWIPIGFGFLAIVLWIYLALISNKNAMKRMGDTWRKHQSLFSQIAFVAIFLHLVIMKWQGWLKWFQGLTKASPELANPSYPPASLFVLAILIIVLLYRFVAMFKKR